MSSRRSKESAIVAECCIEAIRRGVKKVFIIDGRVPHSILIETLTDAGIGTMFVTGDNFDEY